MNKYISVVAMLLLLTGCDGKKQIEAGDYLTEDIQVKFDNSHQPGDNSNRDDLQKQIANTLKDTLGKIYFSVTPTEMTWYAYGRNASSSVKDGRIRINDVWYSIKPGRNHTITLVSDKAGACGFYNCEITSTIKKADMASPKLVKLKQDFAQRVKAWQERLASENEEFKRIPMADFPGTLFSPADGLALKLPFKVQDSVSRWSSGFYVRRMNQLLIDKENENTLIYTYSDKPNEIEGDLIVVSGKRDDFNITTWLAAQHGVVFQSEQGAVYYNQYGNLETLYFQYDDVTQRYFIGLGYSESIDAAAKAFSMLRTMDVHYRGKNLISITDITLPEKRLEEKYQTKVSDIFNITEIHQAIYKAVEELLEKPHRFIGHGSSRDWVSIKLGSQTFDSKIGVALYTKPITELIAETQLKQPKSKLFEDILVYGDDGEEDYSYYRDLGNGLTLKFTVPYEVGNMAERILLLSVLRQLDITALPQIPTHERKNLFKYSDERYATSKPTDQFFTINEGLIDSRGNLIIPTPSDGYFEFSELGPFILATKWQDQGDNTYRRTSEGFIFDQQGKPLLHTATFGELVDHRLVIGGDGKKQGLYDLSTHRWLAAPTWDELRWQDGLFIATDLAPSSDEITRTVLRESLLDKQGQVLATGKRLETIENTDKLTVIGDKEVSLVDRRGRVLFSHAGSELSYIPEIDGYAVLVSQPDSHQRQLGIFSEQGQTILPPKYGDYRVLDDRMQMWAPDLRHYTFFDLRQLKDWRNHQLLQEVPAP